MPGSAHLALQLSANRTGLPSSGTSSRQKLFDAGYDLGGRQLEDICEFKNSSKAGTISSAFEKADVFGMIATFKREDLLGQISLAPQLTEYSCKRSLFGRDFIVCSGHPQHKVCGSSINTSTNYTFLFPRKVEGFLLEAT
jgi:hypothetical protein